MAHPKQLLMPWLQSQITSGRYPGVKWTNSEQTEFSIPWKHALRQDSSDTDILIFKAWAEVSGNGRAQGDPSVWKRNFRSALRAKGFTLLSDMKNDSANPHKVFRWPRDFAPGANSSSGSQEQDHNNAFEGFDMPDDQVDQYLGENLYLSEGVFDPDLNGQDILQECLKGLNIGPEPEAIVGFEPAPEQQQLPNPVVIGGLPLPGQQRDPVMFEGAAGGTGLPEQPACPARGAVGGVCGEEQRAKHLLHEIHNTSDVNYFKTQFKVIVYYRGVTVLEQLVENEAGLRLVYRPHLHPGAFVDPETGLSLVSLPTPTAMLDQTQRNLTQTILNKLGDGLDVKVSGHEVHGQRRGEIKVYWSFSKFDNSGKPKEISKLQPDSLYHFKDYLQGMQSFCSGGDCPPCSLFFCLGEKWPDPVCRPWVKKLITVEVVFTSMEHINNLAVCYGSSSLQSVELQMSLEEMMDLY